MGLLDPSLALAGVNVTAFDTRTASKRNRIPLSGYASPGFARRLGEAGGNLLTEPDGFVLGMQGPLKEGELERPGGWAKGIIAQSGCQSGS